MIAPRHQRLIAWLVMGFVVVAGGYTLGPVRDRQQCRGANHSRQELREAFHIVVTGFGDDPRLTQLDEQVQAKLRAGLPERTCNTLLWPLNHLLADAAPVPTVSNSLP